MTTAQTGQTTTSTSTARGGNWWDVGTGGAPAVSTVGYGPDAAARRVLIDAVGPSRSVDNNGAILPDLELLKRARLATHPDRPQFRDGVAHDRVLDAALALDLIKKPTKHPSPRQAR